MKKKLNYAYADNADMPVGYKEPKHVKKDKPAKREHQVDYDALSNDDRLSVRSDRSRRSINRKINELTNSKAGKTARQRKEETFYYANAGFLPAKDEKTIRREIIERDFSQGRRALVDPIEDGRRRGRDAVVSKSVNLDKKEFKRKLTNDLAQKKHDRQVEHTSHYVLKSDVDFDDKKLKRMLANSGYHVYDVRTTHNPITGKGLNISLKVHKTDGSGNEGIEKQFKQYNLGYEKMPTMEYPDAHKVPGM